MPIAQPRKPSAPPHSVRRAVWLAIGAMVLFFASLSFAYLARALSGSAGILDDWLQPPVPLILTINTLVLLLSSGTLWVAHRALTRRHPERVLLFVGLTLVLGLLFLFGQWQAWRMLLALGIGAAGMPNSAFFYLASGAHALHLTLGLGVLVWLLMRSWRGRLPWDRPLLMEAAGILWHSLDVTWLALYLTLLFTR